jgi:hypothetical protein
MLLLVQRLFMRDKNASPVRWRQLCSVTREASRMRLTGTRQPMYVTRLEGVGVLGLGVAAGAALSVTLGGNPPASALNVAVLTALGLVVGWSNAASP